MIVRPDTDEATFKNQLMDGIRKPSDDGIMKRPAGKKMFSTPLAIQDKQSDNQGTDKTAGNTRLKKRPASALTEENMSKKPATALTEENLESHDEKTAAQNNTVNKAIENCLTQLQAKVTTS